MTEGDDEAVDAETIEDIDHEPPEGAADPNAVWERGDEPVDDDAADDTERR